MMRLTTLKAVDLPPPMRFFPANYSINKEREPNYSFKQRKKSLTAASKKNSSIKALVRNGIQNHIM